MQSRPNPRRNVRARRDGLRRIEVLEDRRLLSGSTSTDSLLQAYGQLPLSFEANQGQTDAQVRYLARGDGYALFITPTAAVLNIQAAGVGASQGIDGVALKMQLVGANASPNVIGQGPQAGTTNILNGNDPSDWYTGIASYAKVLEQGVYPGVDLVYYGNQQQLEYDFTVAPGADPGAIKLDIQGAESTTIDAQGNLVLHTAIGDVVEQSPVLYQESGGVRQAVSGQYVLDADGQVGFAVGAYDHSLPLVIDPTLSYSTYLGGSPSIGNEDATDSGAKIAVDAEGNAYIVGTTISSKFPTTTGAYQTTPDDPVGTPGTAPGDVFVTKLNASGTALVYSTYLGGSDQDLGSGIAIDAAGDAYVTGHTDSINFPTTPGAYQPATQGITGTFVTKLSPDGSSLVYSTLLAIGTTSNDIAVDSGGDAYITGSGSGFLQPTPGAFQAPPTAGSSTAAYVTKFSPDGSSRLYTATLGDGNTLGIAVDAAGNAYVTGDVNSPNYPTTPRAYQTTGQGNVDAVVTKINSNGSALVYSTRLGGSAPDHGVAIAVDAAGNAYVTGDTISSDFPTTSGAFQTTFRGSDDAFVTKVNPTGSGLVYSTYLGGSKAQQGLSIGIDAVGDAYVTGSTLSADFPTADAIQGTYGGDGDSAIAGDAFVTGLNPQGTALLYSTYLGGSGGDVGSGIAVDQAGNAYITGSTDSTNYPTTTGAFQTSLASGFYVQNAFVTKVALGQAILPTTTTVDLPKSSTEFQTIDVTVAAGSGVTKKPTGTVIFTERINGGVPITLGTSPLGDDGTASFTTTTPLPSGSVAVFTAEYGGNDVFVSSSSQATLVTPAAKTTTTLGSSPNPSTFGRNVTFTAVIGVADGGIARGQSDDTVTFTIDGKVAGTTHVTVVDGKGQATFTTSALAIGSHTVVASYSGSSSFEASTSSAITQVVRAAPLSPTTTALSASPNPSTVGQAVTFTATVARIGGLFGAPSGTVTFLDGSTVLGTAGLDSAGHATFTTASLGAGPHTITATYSGDGGFSPSHGSLVQSVTAVAAQPPTVSSLRRLVVGRFFTVLVLKFDQALDPTTAQNPKNFLLTLPRGQRIFFRSISYDRNANTVTLIPSQRLNPFRLYVLTVVGIAPSGVKGADSLLLDGANTGQPGSSYVSMVGRFTPFVQTTSTRSTGSLVAWARSRGILRG